MFRKLFIFSENFTVHEIMWENIVEPDRRHMTMRRMRLAFWILKSINTHFEYVILIAFLLQHSGYYVD